MTFEQILLLYIYQNKKLSLDLFGTIELDGSVPDPEILRKEKSIPVEGLKFIFNPLVKTDADFIQFYASEKGKIIPLAISDIELQLHQAKQIVNIGNPYDIPGVGKIVKMDDGKLTMQPGYYTIPPISGSGRPVVLKERGPVATMTRSEREAKPVGMNQKQKQIAFLSIIGVVAVAAVWAFVSLILPLFQQSNKNEPISVVNMDTSKGSETVDTIMTNDSSGVATISYPVDSTALQPWKAFIGNAFGLQKADERLGRLKSYGHDVKMETTDSSNFMIYIPVRTSIRDTAHIRDSLSKFFAYKVRLEPANLP